MKTEQAVKLTLEKINKIPKIIDNLDFILDQYSQNEKSNIEKKQTQDNIHNKSFFKFNNW